MNSFFIRMIGATKSAFLTASLTVVILAVTSPAAFADGGSWFLDSTTSDARFFQGSATNPNSVNTGVARVTGEVKLDENNLDSSVFDLSIYPADENWGHALNAEGTLPSGYVPDPTDHTLLTFKSKRILKTSDGKLEVIGNLTLTRVERSVTLTPNEAFAGPVYGDPVIHTENREVMFFFPSSITTPRSEGLSPAQLEVSGSAGIGRENFPELLSAISDTNWPSVVQNEHCTMPSTIGDDYSGAQCTGTVIAATNHDNCQMPASIGDDYSGPICAPPAGDQTTIVVNLKLQQAGSESSSETLSAVGTSR
ncbi:MAG: YceI family protein [Candidatus Sulfotelmatobacter sp.]